MGQAGAMESKNNTYRSIEKPMEALKICPTQSRHNGCVVVAAVHDAT
jgi:hypothetical protein